MRTRLDRIVDYRRRFDMHKTIFMILLAVLLLTGAFQPSQAALTAVGPVTPATGYFPAWYSDGTRTLELCLSTTPSLDPAAGGGPMCSLLPAPGVYDPALPVVFPLNFPDESFYYTAEAIGDIQKDPAFAAAGVDLRYVAALESAFAAGAVADGDQVVFARIRFFVQVPTPGTYIITHPFGVDTFVVDTIDPVAREIQFTRDIGIGAPGVFSGALNGDVWPFLVRSLTPGGAPAPIVMGTETFLGDPNVTQNITGSRFGTNYVRVQGPGIDVRKNRFAISGKIYGGTLPAPLSVDRVTYNRTAAGEATVDLFATSAPGASVTFRETVAAGAETPLTGDAASGKFFTQYAPATLPANLIVTGDQAGAPSTSLGAPIVDVVKITNVSYSFTAKELTIEAASSDQLSPLPTLTAVGWGTLAPLPASTTQSLVVANVVEPPAVVTVVSSAGGKDTESVIVPNNIAPIAVNNRAVVMSGSKVRINVLANDNDPDGTLDPASVSIVAAPLNGTANVTVDGLGGVRYVPAVGFVGTDSFTYTVADNLGAVSNAATVTVTVADAAVQLGVINAIYNRTTLLWKIEGFGAVNGATVTIHLGPDLTGPVVGTAIVRRNRWVFSGVSIRAGAVRTISAESTAGGVALGAPFRVRR